MFVSGVKVSIWNSHGRRETADPFFYFDCVFPCILKVICKKLVSHVFFRQLAKLTPELVPTVVSEHETSDSVQQVLGHTTILWISCSKSWRHKFLQQLPTPIEFLSACQKLFGRDRFCELQKNMGHSTELERRGENVQKRRGEVNMCKLVTSLAKTTKGRIGPSQIT